MSYAVFSDELYQDKVNDHAFNSAILEKVKEVTSVKTVLYGSDGVGSQLKNRYNLASLLYHEEAVDGVGGEVKRSMWWAILQGNTVVTNAENFFLSNLKITLKNQSFI